MLCELWTSWISLTERIIYKSSDFAFHQTPTRGTLLKFISKKTIQWDRYNVHDCCSLLSNLGVLKKPTTKNKDLPRPKYRKNDRPVGPGLSTLIGHSGQAVHKKIGHFHFLSANGRRQSGTLWIWMNLQIDDGRIAIWPRTNNPIEKVQGHVL